MVNVQARAVYCQQYAHACAQHLQQLSVHAARNQHINHGPEALSCHNVQVVSAADMEAGIAQLQLLLQHFRPLPAEHASDCSARLHPTKALARRNAQLVSEEAPPQQAALQMLAAEAAHSLDLLGKVRQDSQCSRGAAFQRQGSQAAFLHKKHKLTTQEHEAQIA